VSSGKILIVDDSENVRSVLQLNFEYLGYQVFSAKDGEEALGLVEREDPDVVVLDVMMPRQNGFQVCRKIKADPRHSGTPVIFLTAKGHKEDRYWGRDCGADEYLTKPFSSAELERVIERLIDGRQHHATMARFDDEVERRRRQGEPFGILTLTFEAKALHTFRQKYGEFRFHEALDGIGQTVELVVREESGESLAWMAGDGVLKTVLPGEPDRAAALRDRIVLQGNLLLESFYDGEDAGRGYVVSRAAPDGRELHVPMLKIEAALAFEGPGGRG
jgi:DNA-binding response OmpR family regulator